MDKGMLNLLLEGNMSLLFPYTSSYLHKRPSHIHIYIPSSSKCFCTFVMVGIAPLQVVVGSQLKEYWHLGQIKKPEVEVGGCWEGIVSKRWDLPFCRLPVRARGDTHCLRDISTKMLLSLSFMKLWNFPCSGMSIGFCVDHGGAMGGTPAQVFPICPNLNGGSESSQWDESKTRRDLLFTDAQLQGQGFNLFGTLGGCS